MNNEPKWQYFYKRNNCPAKTSSDGDCICWHDEGTGLFSTERHDDEVTILQWRQVEQPQ